MKYKFVKFGSSLRYCLNPNTTTKNRWKIALRDPAYLLSWIIMISVWVFIIFNLT